MCESYANNLQLILNDQDLASVSPRERENLA